MISNAKIVSFAPTTENRESSDHQHGKFIEYKVSLAFLSFVFVYYKFLHRESKSKLTNKT